MPPKLPTLRLLLPVQNKTLQFLNLGVLRGFARAASPPRVFKPMIDEDIPSTVVNFVDTEGVFHEARQLSDLLSLVDRRKEHIICINALAFGQTPLCKIITKEKLANLDKEKFEKAKLHKQKQVKKTQVCKEVEFSWAISVHDLGHRMNKMQQFLEKGYKVDITLGTKRGMQKQPLTTMEDLVQKLRDDLGQWGREWAQPQGDIGRRYTLFFKGKGILDDNSDDEKNEAHNVGKEHRTS